MNLSQLKNQKKILVVAESGLLTDIYLKQSSHSVYIWRQTQLGVLTLAIPEYAFSETDGQLHQRLLRRLNQIEEMRRFINELLREEDMVASAEQLREILNRIGEQTVSKRHLIQENLSEIASGCEVIPMTFEAFRRGKLRFLRSTPPPDENDCQILASIICYLEEHQNNYDLKIFLCHDQRHFDFPTIHQSIRELNAQMVFSSASCLQAIRVELT